MGKTFRSSPEQESCACGAPAHISNSNGDVYCTKCFNSQAVRIARFDRARKEFDDRGD